MDMKVPSIMDLPPATFGAIGLSSRHANREREVEHNARSGQAAGLLAWLGTCFTAAAIGGFGSRSAGSLYQQLERPAWAPPGWLFGPAWTVVYAMMAVAAWLVWRSAGWRSAPAALTLFLGQLALNALWSWLFFGWRQGGWAFAEILLLWAGIAATLIAFLRMRPLAGALLVPYLSWVSFAAVLNYSIWQRNPALLGG
jgi:translocator protein